MEQNEIMTFFYFMWNYWNRETCLEAFADAACGPDYLWERYCGFYDDYGSHGVISAFTAYLDAENKKLLLNYALKFMTERKGYKLVSTL